MIRGVCFDLDGTLLRDDKLESVVQDVAAQVVARHPELDQTELGRANARAWTDYWPEIGEDWMTGRVPSEAVAREVWRRTLVAFDIQDDDTVERALAAHNKAERASFELYPEARGVLGELRERGIRIAIITNGPSDLQRSKLIATRLESEVDAIVVSGEHGVEKPEEEIFRIALTLLGLDAGEALHIGDNQVADVAGARRAGLSAVWIDRVGAEQECDPDAVVTDLRGLLDLV